MNAVKHRRYSKQRQAVLDVLLSTKSHPTAEWIFMELKKTNPSIGIATVYRNLKLLEQEGEILRISTGDGVDHYDATCDNHYHFACSSCGRILDFDVAPLFSEEKLLNGCEVDRFSLIFYGRCGECIKNN